MNFKNIENANFIGFGIFNSGFSQSDIQAVEAFSKDTIGDVFVVVEENPFFPGGDEAMYKFLVDNLVYPEDAKAKGISGRVYINFVIEKNGEISNIKVLRGVCSSIDAEAIRVVKLMPKWNPGMQRGKPVRVNFNLPINFQLSNKKKK